ncbi:hypothetical protein Pcinc_031875 [Petrolisthes cinctipes]|uniref:Uncharacterized protein n=1 Tax=Petrolisthes cinctipes TaxID=88211 RepID=A0AAE1EVA6_PETCI|nr:hypothetical protein Pcinc_031875 [Petrolisthes cinctipes]
MITAGATCQHDEAYMLQKIQAELRDMSQRFLRQQQEERETPAGLQDVRRGEEARDGTEWTFDKKSTPSFITTGKEPRRSRDRSGSRTIQEMMRRMTGRGSTTTRSGRERLKKRASRHGCPGNIGNFGFNSYNLLTFALQVFNGVINTINNLNNNNNNNNINSVTNANSNANEQNSNVNSMTQLTVVAASKRRRRKKKDVRHNTDPNEVCENGLIGDKEVQRMIQDTYSTVADIVKVQHRWI